MGLQFSWIEANLLGFFLADVRNSRGKFDEIKEKFTINPSPIASQSSLNAGGSRWTRELPRNSLNSFTNRSKFGEQREEYIGFKGEISPKSWAIEAIVEAVWWRRGGNFVSIDRGFNCAMNRWWFQRHRFVPDLDRAISAFMKIQRSLCCQVASGEPSDRVT